MVTIVRTDEVPSDAGRGLPLPWQLKIALKLVLGRLPIPYGVWRRIGIFRHGHSDIDPERAIGSMQRGLDHFFNVRGVAPLTCLEMGPGDTVAGALVAASKGARAIMIDVGDFATHDMSVYRAIADLLPGMGAVDFSSRAAMLLSCGATYLVGGLASLKRVSASSVDLVVSTSVLEHIRAAEFDETLREVFRVTRPGGVAFHSVDFMDHLGGGLNNLRFSSTIWERPDFSALGFYTNRLRLSEIKNRAEAAGFIAEIPWAALWPSPPLDSARLAPEFRWLSEEDLRIALCELSLTKAG